MSVIGAYYYLRAIKLMYFDKPDDVNHERNVGNPDKLPLDFSLLLSANGLSVIALGIFPGALMSICLWAIKTSL